MNNLSYSPLTSKSSEYSSATFKPHSTNQTSTPKMSFERANEITVNSTIAAIYSFATHMETEEIDGVWGVSVYLKDGTRYFFYTDIMNANSTTRKVDNVASKTVHAR